MSSDADDQLKPEDWTIDERDAEQDAAGENGQPAQPHQTLILQPAARRAL
jgi:hypothetical protein